MRADTHTAMRRPPSNPRVPLVSLTQHRSHSPTARRLSSQLAASLLTARRLSSQLAAS
eukprot:CAMPEP_0174714124 /NCGR_PEP_ID=MMETSP1094-20130205/16715_1 /TAXON_ID=156173 /ORGANISM="Chrysochromulina brevifilum, Strain UTEX LB 985" /LENGTH=57 /DNA_ID=CAMNT_0015913413 /DNA_START=1 /DNA_END=170 /DNA_ORIENTATION=+